MTAAAAILVRSATELDQAAIRALVRRERLNPTGLDWPNFVVAAHERGLVGAVQMRRHRDGSRELGSLIVARQARGHGIAARLIDALLATEPGRVLMITGGAFAAHYGRWGFRRIEPGAAPALVRRNYRIGRAMSVVRRVLRRPFRRLVILERSVPHDLVRLEGALPSTRLPTASLRLVPCQAEPSA